MIRSLLSLLLLVSTASAISYAVDFSFPTNITQLNCLRNANYGTVLTRVFSPDGSVDKNGVETMSLIQKNKMLMNVDAYLTPQPNVGNGSVQVEKAYEALTKNGIQFEYLYIQVCRHFFSELQYPEFQIARYISSWSSDTSANIQFILDMCNRARYYGKSVGIYSSYSDWVAITGNVKTLVPNLKLWYYDVNGPGVTGESQPNLNDFVAFGPFKKSMVRFKQFAMVENVCGVDLNRDIQIFD